MGSKVAFTLTQTPKSKWLMSAKLGCNWAKDWESLCGCNRMRTVIAGWKIGGCHDRLLYCRYMHIPVLTKGQTPLWALWRQNFYVWSLILNAYLFCQSSILKVFRERSCFFHCSLVALLKQMIKLPNIIVVHDLIVPIKISEKYKNVVGQRTGGEVTIFWPSGI